MVSYGLEGLLYAVSSFDVMNSNFINTRNNAIAIQGLPDGTCTLSDVNFTGVTKPANCTMVATVPATQSLWLLLTALGCAVFFGSAGSQLIPRPRQFRALSDFVA
jgi:hypothetical protein